MVVGGLVHHAEGHHRAASSRRLELASITALGKEAVWIVAFGQRDSARVYAVLSEPAGE